MYFILEKLGKQEEEIINKFNLNCIVCSLKDINIHVIYKMIQWMRSEHVRNELGKHRLFLVKELQKKCYVCWYGLFAIIAEMKLNKILISKKFRLYSYWLSRPAYTAAYIKKQHENNCVFALSWAHRYDLYENRNTLNYLPFREFVANWLDEICFISKDEMDYFIEHIMQHIVHKPSLKIKRLGTKKSADIIKQVKEKSSVVIASCSSIMEAICFRLPVIARAVGGNSEIVDDTNGYLLDEVTDLDMKKIYEFVQIRFNDIECYKEKSSNSMICWEIDYNPNKNYTEFFKYL